MEQDAGPLAYAIKYGPPMTIRENVRVDLLRTRITDLDKHTVEIVAADHSEDNAERIQGQLVGKVASITMDVVLHWENGRRPTGHPEIFPGSQTGTASTPSWSGSPTNRSALKK